MQQGTNPDDIWYAIANTEVVLSPQKKLETFGSTVITYHLLTEKMDGVHEIRVREGRVHADRPQVLAPAYFERILLDGFGKEAEGYVQWLRNHVHDLTFLKHGFCFRKEDIHETIIHETIETATARVKAHVESKGDPLTAVIKGVDDSWETCILKFAVDIIRQSVPDHMMAFRKRKLLEDVEGIPRAVHEEIEQDFLSIGSDSSKMKALAEKLRHYGVFESYEDRFYAVVRRLSS